MNVRRSKIDDNPSQTFLVLGVDPNFKIMVGLLSTNMIRAQLTCSLTSRAASRGIHHQWDGMLGERSGVFEGGLSIQINHILRSVRKHVSSSGVEMHPSYISTGSSSLVDDPRSATVLGDHKVGLWNAQKFLVLRDELLRHQIGRTKVGTS